MPGPRPAGALLFVLLLAMLSGLNAQKQPTGPAPAVTHTEPDLHKDVKGRIKINGEIFETQCDCAKDAITKKAAEIKERSVNRAKCHRPQKYQIFYDRHEKAPTHNESKGFHSAQLLQFLGKPSELKWVNASLRTLSDIDGRLNAAMIASPGGEAGEFINAMQVYEEMRGIENKAGQARAGQNVYQLHNLKYYLTEYLKHIRPRKFAMHTNLMALESLQQDMVMSSLDITDPPPNADVRDALLGKRCTIFPCGLMSPSNVGVHHLQFMLSYPQMYNVQKSIVEEFIREFYLMLWDEDSPFKKQMEFTTLRKVKEEKAFVTIEVAPGCRQEHKVPLVQPYKETVVGDRKYVTSVFISHPDAAAIRRTELAQFFSKIDPGHHVQAREMESRLHMKGDQGLRETAKNLAQGLPVFRVLVL